MMRLYLPPSCAGWKSRCAISNGCSAAKPWRTRSSRRRSSWRGQKNDLAVQLCAAGRFPMKPVTDTLGLARSNIAERVKGVRPKRGPQTRDGDLELTAAIRRLVDARPTYGYRRIAALLKRERRSDGLAPVNATRVYRLMKRHGS